MRIDWPVLMRAGMREMQLAPAEFWRLTPAEFALLLGQDAHGAPLTRDRLMALSQAYPDRKDDTDG